MIKIWCNFFFTFTKVNIVKFEVIVFLTSLFYVFLSCLIIYFKYGRNKFRKKDEYRSLPLFHCSPTLILINRVPNLNRYAKFAKLYWHSGALETVLPASIRVQVTTWWKVMRQIKFFCELTIFQELSISRFHEYFFF